MGSHVDPRSTWTSYLSQGIEKKEAMKLVAKDRGIGKRDVYQMLLEE